VLCNALSTYDWSSLHNETSVDAAVKNILLDFLEN
jgi:hypothetical protein